jgi:ketosteroid isomerase-like protein
VAFLNAIVRGDFTEIEALLHPACTWWVQGWGMLDRERLLAGLADTIGRSSARRMDVQETTAEADRVSITAEGMFRFPEGDYCNSYHYLFTVADGQVLSGREYLDTRIAAQFYGGAAD